MTEASISLLCLKIVLLYSSRHNWQQPTGGKYIFTEFNLATWLRLVKFIEFNISQF